MIVKDTDNEFVAERSFFFFFNAPFSLKQVAEKGHEETCPIYFLKNFFSQTFYVLSKQFPYTQPTSKATSMPKVNQHARLEDEL